MRKDSPPSKDVFFERRYGMLVCPGCGETLARSDVEEYSRCPYCDTRFTLNGDLEDFILKPAIDNWYHMNLGQIQKFGHDMEAARTNWL